MQRSRWGPVAVASFAAALSLWVPGAESAADMWPRCTPELVEKRSVHLDVLTAPLPTNDPTAFAQLTQSINALIIPCDGPSAVPALFRVFLRSRYGVPDPSADWSPLPEDPDLFERALLALSHQPPEAVAEGAQAGLGTGLTTLAWHTLRHDWLRPAVQGLGSADQRFLEDWSPPAALPSPAHQLVQIVEDTPQEAIFAMTTGGGSLVQDAVRPLQDHLLAAFLTDAAARPAVVRAVAGVVVDGGLSGPAVATALHSLQPGDADTRAAVDRAKAAVGTPSPWPPLRLPAVAPGRIPGLEAHSHAYRMASSVVTENRSTRLPPGTGRTLLGLLLLVGALGLGRFRRLRAVAGPMFGLGLMAGTDGLLDLCAVAPPASAHPLFQFIAQSDVQLRPTDNPHRVVVGGGSMRFAELDRVPTDTRRVVFLGASSVHGSHYIWEDTFPAKVGSRLGVEAINFGIGGTTSAGVAAAGRTALTLQPDALVVMYGHNEVAQFTRLALYRHTRPALLRARFQLSKSAIYRMLTQPLARPDTRAAPPSDLYRSDTPSREEVADLTRLAVDHLRLQLGGLADAAHAHDVPMVLVLPPTNLRFAHLQPFDTPGPGDQADLQRLREQAEAVAQARQGGKARLLFQEAIDRSASPREVVTPIRDALVELGESHGLVVVDAQAWMSSYAPDGVTPSGLYWDDVHPTAEGHTALAHLLSDVLEPILAGGFQRASCLPDRPELEGAP